MSMNEKRRKINIVNVEKWHSPKRLRLFQHRRAKAEIGSTVVLDDGDGNSELQKVNWIDVLLFTPDPVLDI